jgi:putative transposase
MPYGLKRFQKAESLHFITFSCFHRLPFLSSAETNSAVEAILEETRARHSARLYAYVLVPEHMYLLLNEPPGILLGQFLKAFKQMASRRLKSSIKGSTDHFWQARYYDENIHGEEARSEVIRYIHRNPVKRGLVERPEQFPWSSYSHYTTGNRGTIEIESEWTAWQRERPLIAIEPR